MSAHQQTFTTRWRGADWTIRELAYVTGIDASTLHMRYRAGKRGEALTAPVRKAATQRPVRPPRIEIASRGLL